MHSIIVQVKELTGYSDFLSQVNQSHDRYITLKGLWQWIHRCQVNHLETSTLCVAGKIIVIVFYQVLVW